LCVFIFSLQTFAIGSGAQYVLSKGTLGNFLSVNIAGGLGLTFGIYFSGGVSGKLIQLTLLED
jgi:glycerol uptake facilitator-like aquaporin